MAVLAIVLQGLFMILVHILPQCLVKSQIRAKLPGLAKLTGLCCIHYLLILATPGQASAWQSELRAHTNIALWSGFTQSPFASDTVDHYGGNWRALQIPLQTAQTYASLPDFFYFQLHAHRDTTWEVYTQLPIQRDLEAWYQSNYRHNIPMGANELNINVPYKTWGAWRGSHAFLKVGRFKPDISPSPNAVVLSGAPWHDALWWQFRIGKARYDFLALSLDPRLHGTPTIAGGPPPEGSEAWQQQNLHKSNQRRRIYSQPHKNHFAHRLGYNASWGWIAIIEQGLVGGKSPDLRDINPFTAWHNNYGDGFVKVSTALELAFTPLNRGAFYWQICIEDLQSPVGETLGPAVPSTIGFMAGWRQNWQLSHRLQLNTRLDAVLTDPGYNHHRLPLLRAISRQSYRSNFRRQEEANFADTYVMDFPLGYHRGPDAVDLWLNWELFASHSIWRLHGELAWLRQGSSTLQSPWETVITYSTPLSGITERETRAQVGLDLRLPQGLQAHWQLGLRQINNAGHQPGASRQDALIAASISSSLRLLGSQ